MKLLSFSTLDAYFSWTLSEPCRTVVVSHTNAITHQFSFLWYGNLQPENYFHCYFIIASVMKHYVNIFWDRLYQRGHGLGLRTTNVKYKRCRALVSVSDLRGSVYNLEVSVRFPVDILYTWGCPSRLLLLSSSLLVMLSYAFSAFIEMNMFYSFSPTSMSFIYWTNLLIILICTLVPLHSTF